MIHRRYELGARNIGGRPAASDAAEVNQSVVAPRISSADGAAIDIHLNRRPAEGG